MPGIKFTVLPLLITFIVIAFLFSSVGIVTAVTGNSLPGDVLFPLKTKLENVRVKSTDNSTAQARLHLQFADRRLSEMRSLFEQGRYADITLATGEFTRNIQQTSGIVQNLSQVDPVQASALNGRVLVLLRGYSELLASNLVRIPVDIQPVVERVESTPQSSLPQDDGDTIQSDDGDNHSDVVPAIIPTMTPMIIILSTTTPANISAGAESGLTMEGDDATCRGSVGAVTVENLRVPQGASCILDGTQAQGNIKVENGASLTAQRVRVIGTIQAEGARIVEVLAGSTVGGSIQLKQGGSARVEYVVVNGDVQLESNNGFLSIVGNQVGGNLQVFQNAGGITIGSNTVIGNLQCKENHPAPGGGNNVVQGNKEDQCAQW